MTLVLTVKQNVDRERLGACVIPGERDPAMFSAGFVVVDRATVILLPVYDADNRTPADVIGDYILVSHTAGWVVLMRNGASHKFVGPFDPLPVARRDRIAVFKDTP